MTTRALQTLLWSFHIFSLFSTCYCIYMFWVCLYFFLFPDLSGEDKTQSADTEDGQSWPKGERYLSCCGVKHFHFNDISDSVAVSDHWYILRIVGSLMYCAIPAEVSANYLTYVQDCTLNQQFACTDLLWFVLFFFRLTVGSLMYLGQCDVDMLTRASTAQRTVER